MLLSYEDACFYKLLLQCGFKEEVLKWIDDIAYNNETLEGIYLDLVCAKDNINELISCLHNYIVDKQIDEKKLCNKLREFVKDEYKDGKLSLKEVSECLYGFAVAMERTFENDWLSFSIIGEYYDLAVDGIINGPKFQLFVEKYLETGEDINSDLLWKNTKITIKDIIKNEKQQMNSIRYKINYIFVPIFLFVAASIIITNSILLSIDEEKYTPLCIVLFSIFGLIILAMIISVPFITKKELKLEMEKYDFTIQKDQKEECSVESLEGIKFIFKETELVINNIIYKYDDFNINIYTLNTLRTIRINLEFVFKKSDNFVYWNIRLNNDLLNAVTKLNINITNKPLLEYIINNKEKAFKQILNYGYVRKMK